MEGNNSLIGRNLHMLLYDRRMTQCGLAERLGVSPQMVSAIVVGKKLPSVRLLVRMAEALEVTPNALLGGEVSQ